MLDSTFEKIGIFTSKSLKYPFKKWIERKIDNFDIKVFGIENIDKLKNQAFVLASNHILPHDRGLLNLGWSADSFILGKLILDKTGKEVALASNYLLNIPVLKRLLENFTKGVIIGIGSVPVGKGRKSFHDVFLKSVRKVVSQKRPILIYPVGAQHEDFEETHEIKAGAGYIALKYDLPIVPVYIKGACEWGRENQLVYLIFGKPFSTRSLSIDEIKEKIKKGILGLKLQVQK